MKALRRLLSVFHVARLVWRTVNGPGNGCGVPFDAAVWLQENRCHLTRQMVIWSSNDLKPNDGVLIAGKIGPGNVVAASDYDEH